MVDLISTANDDNFISRPGKCVLGKKESCHLPHPGNSTAAVRLRSDHECHNHSEQASALWVRGI